LRKTKLILALVDYRLPLVTTLNFLFLARSYVKMNYEMISYDLFIFMG